MALGAVLDRFRPLPGGRIKRLGGVLEGVTQGLLIGVVLEPSPWSRLGPLPGSERVLLKDCFFARLEAIVNA